MRDYFLAAVRGTVIQSLRPANKYDEYCSRAQRPEHNIHSRIFERAYRLSLVLPQMSTAPWRTGRMLDSNTQDQWSEPTSRQF